MEDGQDGVVGIAFGVTMPFQKGHQPQVNNWSMAVIGQLSLKKEKGIASCLSLY